MLQLVLGPQPLEFDPGLGGENLDNVGPWQRLLQWPGGKHPENPDDLPGLAAYGRTGVALGFLLDKVELLGKIVPEMIRHNKGALVDRDFTGCTLDGLFEVNDFFPRQFH